MTWHRGDVPPAHSLYCSERLPHKDQRRIARAELRAGREPEPVYRSGKQWFD